MFRRYSCKTICSFMWRKVFCRIMNCCFIFRSGMVSDALHKAPKIRCNTKSYSLHNYFSMIKTVSGELLLAPSGHFYSFHKRFWFLHINFELKRVLYGRNVNYMEAIPLISREIFRVESIWYELYWSVFLNRLEKGDKWSWRI